MKKKDTYRVEIAGVVRDLPLLEVKPGLRIAILNILGDTELVQAAAQALAERLQEHIYDVLATAEAKSIPLIHALSVLTGRPYVVFRKTYKPYMGETLHTETLSITTGKPQNLYLDEKDIPLLHRKKVLLVDDVISTGSTLKGMESLVLQANGMVTGYAAIMTEGDPDDWREVIALGHLPLFTD